MIFIFDLNSDNFEFDEFRKKRDVNIFEHTERWKSSIDIVSDCKAVLCSKIGKEPYIELRKLGIKGVELNCTIKEGLKECVKHLKLPS
ncbi:MAG: nitrogen fixation protein [Methanobrevibacter sp.]|nr:nitrogen fixation protein [Candidatus Methanovirga procula]